MNPDKDIPEQEMCKIKCVWTLEIVQKGLQVKSNILYIQCINTVFSEWVMIEETFLNHSEK